MGRTSDAKERLIQAAMDLFYTRTYGDVGVQALCEYAGVKKGSFYHFFETKQDLALASLDRWWVHARETAWEKAFSADLPPLKRIARFFELVYEENCRMYEDTGQLCGCPFGNLAVEMSVSDPVIRDKIEQIFEDAIGRLQKTLDDGVALGHLAPMDTRETALALWAYCEGILMLAKARQDLDLLKRLGQRAVRFLQGSGVRGQGSGTRDQNAGIHAQTV